MRCRNIALPMNLAYYVVINIRNLSSYRISRLIEITGNASFCFLECRSLDAPKFRIQFATFNLFLVIFHAVFKAVEKLPQPLNFAKFFEAKKCGKMLADFLVILRKIFNETTFRAIRIEAIGVEIFQFPVLTMEHGHAADGNLDFSKQPAYCVAGLLNVVLHCIRLDPQSMNAIARGTTAGNRAQRFFQIVGKIFEKTF